MIKVGHKPYSTVGTDRHPDNRKEMERGVTITSNLEPTEIPQVLIVGGIGVGFEVAHTQLQAMEAKGEVMLIHREIDESAYEGLESILVYEDEFTDWNGNTLFDSLHDLKDTGLLDKKHKHPHWHKSRW